MLMRLRISGGVLALKLQGSQPRHQDQDCWATSRREALRHEEALCARARSVAADVPLQACCSPCACAREGRPRASTHAGQDHLQGNSNHKSSACDSEALLRLFAGIKNWHYGWSKTKKSWCCSHEQRGCPGTWQGDGLTKTIVTGVTQHIGHGHVHVIHHVHHYSTSSHDVDDLPDVIGDDDASLPPEYRHGDMSVGGDDDSLPPEYRHVDMTVGGDDDDSLRPEHRHVDLNVDE